MRALLKIITIIYLFTPVIYADEITIYTTDFTQISNELIKQAEILNATHIYIKNITPITTKTTQKKYLMPYWYYIGNIEEYSYYKPITAVKTTKTTVFKVIADIY